MWTLGCGHFLSRSMYCSRHIILLFDCPQTPEETNRLRALFDMFRLILRMCHLIGIHCRGWIYSVDVMLFIYGKALRVLTILSVCPLSFPSSFFRQCSRSSTPFTFGALTATPPSRSSRPTAPRSSPTAIRAWLALTSPSAAPAPCRLASSKPAAFVSYPGGCF